jgi:hypothetical protein
MPSEEINSIMICCFSCTGFCLIILSSITTCFGTDITNILAMSFAISGAGLIVISCIVQYNCNNSIYGNRHLENTNSILHQEPLPIIRIVNIEKHVGFEKQMDTELAVAIYVQNNENIQNIQNNIGDDYTETIAVAEPINLV